jgi:putative lysine/arginine/ornithine/histidine/octopine transport system substrate-binding protein
MKYWLVGTVAALSLVAIAHAQEVTVKIGTEADYAPFEYKDASGQLRGCELDPGNRLCVRAHKIDAPLSQMSVTPARAKSVS